MNLLKDRIIVITGASQGIGYAIAEKCTQEGAMVIIAARTESDLKKAKVNLQKDGHKNVESYVIDISDLSQVQEFGRWLQSKYRIIQGLVNCAGIYGPIGATNKVDLTFFEQAIRINFLGTVFMCSELSKLISGTERKKIVNYAGGGAATPFANYSAYAASKIAIVRFTENLSLELAEQRFDINCVAPGFVITRIHQQTLNSGKEVVGTNFYESTLKQIEKGGVSAQKAADLTSFLLSDASNGITGKFISAPWDPWETLEFQQLLRQDKDIATLRRIDNKTFFKKS